MEGTTGFSVEDVARDPIKARIIVKGGDAVSAILRFTGYVGMTGDMKHAKKMAEHVADAIREFERSIEHLL